MMKVISPVEGKEGKTYWMRVGNAFVNKDGSTNVYLNAYPANGKLQIRELDEDDLRPRPRRDGSAAAAGLSAPGGARPQDDLPF